MDAPVFLYRHRVLYAECTAGNHVYYGRYLELLEAARGALFRALGQSFQSWQEQGVIFPVVECYLRYLAPARYDEELSVAVWPAQIGKALLRLEYRVKNAAEVPLLEAWTRHVCTGLDARPRRLPDELRERLQTRLPAASARS